MDFDVCKCNMGWNGSNCAQYSCEQLDYCSGELSLEILYIVYELSYIQISEEHKDFISKNTLECDFSHKQSQSHVKNDQFKNEYSFLGEGQKFS